MCHLELNNEMKSKYSATSSYTKDWTICFYPKDRAQKFMEMAIQLIRHILLHYYSKLAEKIGIET